MRTKDFSNGKYTNDFNADQKKSLEPLADYLTKIGIRKMSCDEGIMEGESEFEFWEDEYDGVEEVPSEEFFLDFELVNNLLYQVKLDYTGRVHVKIKDTVIESKIPNYVFWS